MLGTPLSLSTGAPILPAQAGSYSVRRRALDRIRRALASGAALKAVLGPDETDLRRQAEAMDVADPRLQWLVTNANRWRRANEKTLIFVAHRETLEMLRDSLSRDAQLATGVFHEELSVARRDIEVARFHAGDGPSILISTEAGGEGRNFEFCHRLVLYDLPWNAGPDRLLPSALRAGHGRRAAVRIARAVRRADGRPRAAAGAHRARD
jgi:ATP-dependent helicase HepA